VEPWYKVVTPRKEVREGRSFNPDEFAIHLEQVLAGKAPPDYQKPDQFFDRTCFTRALRDHTGMVLRRLAGKTEGTAPVLTLVTQFGGGKTHTLTALYHLANAGKAASKLPGISDLLDQAGLAEVPKARVAAFVGNAWDPQEGRETPWIDIARQLAGDEGVELLGKVALTTPPGTEALGRLFAAAAGPVLLLFDEVLNFINRHRTFADPFHAFIQNLTVAMTGTGRGVAVVSLPRSQVEMTDFDFAWQERITKVVKRVSKDLIVNDEAEISEVVRRRLFENLGGERLRKNVARAYADWCFERRAQLPPEWTAVDSAATEKKAREHLQERFESCYPFHPATLSVFQRKWQALPQYQQTRGTLAMLAQWISRAYKEGFTTARTEPLITIGSAPLDITDFRNVVLGQLGEPKLGSAIEVDIAGDHSHARALDADTKGQLRDLHRRVGTAILFESSGGQVDKMAHLPELRFALGEPNTDSTSVDTAAAALGARAFFIQRIGSDGYRVYHKAKVEKAVNDRRASLDEETEIKPTMRALVQKEFERGATPPPICFPADDTAVGDLTRLTLVVLDPGLEWTGQGALRERLASWTRKRGNANRLYPGAIVWCARRPGRDLRDKAELLLAWKRVQREVNEGILGAEYDRADKEEIRAKVADAEEAAKDEVWAGYRYAMIADASQPDSLRVIDLGAGHASASQSLWGRIVAALRAEGLLSESVGAGYIDRNWPPALKESGAWPLASLRQSFLNGSLTRLLDPDATLRGRIVDFVSRGEFGLGFGQRPDGTWERCWHQELVPPEEIEFSSAVFLLRKEQAGGVKREGERVVQPTVEPGAPEVELEIVPDDGQEPEDVQPMVMLRIAGRIPAEVWNRLGTKLVPKLRSGAELQAGVEFVVTLEPRAAASLEREVAQILADLGLTDRLLITRDPQPPASASRD
jgi:hypothetical protein